MRLVTRKRLVGVQSFLPDLDRQFVRNKLAFGTVLVDLATVFTADIDGAKNVTDGQMEKSRHRPEDCSLCTFSNTGRPKQEH